ncbi:MAG: two-component regulator propeller domain-containing protein, partial [Rhodothermia bacterium]
MSSDEPGVFETFTYDPDDPTSLCDRAVYKIFEDSAGLIWLGTKNGICTTDRENPGRFERVLTGPEPRAQGGFGSSDYEVYDFLERPEEPGILWVGASRGLYRVDAGSRETEQFVLDPTYEGGNVVQNTVWRLSQDPANPSIIWVPTIGAGLFRFDVRTKRFTRYRADESNPNSLTEDAVISVFTDRSGVVWTAGQTLGASRFNPASVSFAHYRAGAPNDPVSLPGANVWGIFQGGDGVVWVGTQDKANQDRLTALDRANGIARHFEHDPNDPSSLGRGSVMLVFEDHHANLWVGTRGGLDLLDRETGRFRHFRNDPEDSTSIPATAKSMLVDRSGNLWVGTNAGLARMRRDAFGKFDRFISDPDDPNTITRWSVNFLIEDLAGFIWVATEAGLSRVHPETGFANRYEHDPDDPSTLAGANIRVVLERPREPGVLWLGSVGMDRLDVKTGEIRHFTVREGLANNTIY